MKAIIFSVLIGVSAAAFAQEIQFPDFGLMISGQKAAVKADVSVKNFAAGLGASSINVVAKSTTKAPIIYTVKTNNGCNFNVEVVYEANFFDGIKDVVVQSNTAACN